MTFPADKTGNPCAPGPRPAPPFIETSSSGFPRHSWHTVLSHMQRGDWTPGRGLPFLSSLAGQEGVSLRNNRVETGLFTLDTS